MSSVLSIGVTKGAYNLPGNYTPCTIKVTWTVSGTTHSGYKVNGTCTVNGTAHSYSIASIGYNEAKTVTVGTYNIYHSSTTGAKTLKCSANLVTNLYDGTITASSSTELTTLPAGTMTLDLVISESGINYKTNDSLVTAKLYAKANAYVWADNSAGYITINGTKTTFSHSLTKSTNNLLATATKRVPRSSTTGAKTVSVVGDYSPKWKSQYVKNQPATRSETKVLAATPAGTCTLYLATLESELDPLTNTSKVTAILSGASNAYFWGTMSGTIKIGGTSTAISKYIGASQSIELGRATKTVTHVASGTTPVLCEGDVSGNVYHDPSGVSATINLADIPRASYLDTIAAFNIEDGAVVGYTTYTTYTEKLDIKIGSTVIRSGYEVADGETIRFTANELLAIYRTIAEISGDITFDLKTYSGDSLVGETSSKIAVGTIKGNMIKKIAGVQVRGVRIRKINGEWKKMLYTKKINGNWKN